MKLALEKNPRIGRIGGLPWLSCSPFVENSMAVLIHRPRRVTTHKISDKWPSHIGIEPWCGNVMTGTKKFTFLDAPPQGRIVCARCEDAAVAAGLPSSSDLVGHHVHTGGVIAVMRCCTKGGPRNV